MSKGTIWKIAGAVVLAVFGATAGATVHRYLERLDRGRMRVSVIQPDQAGARYEGQVVIGYGVTADFFPRAPQ